MSQDMGVRLLMGSGGVLMRLARLLVSGEVVFFFVSNCSSHVRVSGKIVKFSDSLMVVGVHVVLLCSC